MPPRALRRYNAGVHRPRPPLRPRATRVRWLLGLGCAIALIACDGRPPARRPELAPWQARPGDPADPLVARVGDAEIRASAVVRQARLAVQEPREALTTLIALELLAQEARRREVPVDPEIALAVRQGLVRKLLQEVFEPATGADSMPDAVVRALYDRALAAYVRPPIPRFQSYSFVAPRDQGRAAREEARARAERLVARVRRTPVWTAESFAALRDDPDFGEGQAVYLSALQTPEGPFVGEAARAIATLRAGEVSGLLENERGYHVVRVEEILPARNISFEQARGELREGYYPRWRAERFEEFVREAMTRVGAVVLDQAAVVGPVD